MKSFGKGIFLTAGLAGAIGLCTVTGVQAAEYCYAVSGKVATQAMAPLNPAEQLGTLSLSIGSWSASGVLHGTILNMNSMPVLLKHEMSFGKKGTIFTNGDQAYLSPIDGCAYNVTESMNVVLGTGVFATMTSSNMVAKGKVDMCSGSNAFLVAGKACFSQPLPESESVQR